MACTLLCSWAVRVHVSHAYRNIDTTSDRISLILDRRVMFLSFHIGFSFVIAAVVWAILKVISSLDPSSVITEPRYLNLDTVSNLCPFTVISLFMPSFPQRVISEWNKLPNDCVNASSVNTSKNRIDRYLIRAGYI